VPSSSTNRIYDSSDAAWLPPKRSLRLVAAVSLALLAAFVGAVAATPSGPSPSSEGVGVTPSHAATASPELDRVVPPPPAAAPTESVLSQEPTHVPSAVVASHSTKVVRAPHRTRTGHIRATGTSRDALIFVDGVSLGRGDVTVGCGAHRVSVGMAAMRRVHVPCGGNVSIR
jgi:hypothetical protein